MEKVRLRANMKERLKHLNIHEQVTKIHQTLMSHDLWKKSETIGMTISTPLEMDTRFLIEKAWEENKSVAVPKCIPSQKFLDFRRLSSFNQLESVFYGLQEPIVSLTPSVQKEELDLLLVPGLCFDQRGYRIGFGGGYYDRYLLDFKGIKAALALDEQVLEKVPEEAHDIPVDFIFTPTQVVTCARF